MHDTKPPFLEGKVLTGRGTDVVQPLKVRDGLWRIGSEFTLLQLDSLLSSIYLLLVLG